MVDKPLFIKIVVVWLIVVCTTAYASDPPNVPAELTPKVLTPKRQWEGKHRDESLRKLAQPFVANEKDWQALWRAWRTEKVPKVDFDKQLVLVLTVKGQHRPSPIMFLDRGKVQTHAMAMEYLHATGVRPDGTRFDAGRWIFVKQRGPGFGYLLAVVDREGIITVNGKKVTP